MKFCYKLLILFSIFHLAGCWQAINENDIRLANLYCKSVNSEVAEITANIFGEEHVTCKNNGKSNLGSLKF